MAQVIETTASDVQAWLDDEQAVLIDVREDNELMQARIPGAVHVPLSRFDPTDIPAASGKRVVFVCAIGARSYQAADYMLGQEFLAEAYNLSGGIQAWAQTGLPLERG